MQCARYRVRFGTLQSCVKEGIGCCLLLATCHRHQPIPTVQTARPCLYRAHPTNHTHSHVLGPVFGTRLRASVAEIKTLFQDLQIPPTGSSGGSWQKSWRGVDRVVHGKRNQGLMCHGRWATVWNGTLVGDQLSRLLERDKVTRAGKIKRRCLARCDGTVASLPEDTPDTWQERNLQRRCLCVLHDAKSETRAPRRRKSTSDHNSAKPQLARIGTPTKARHQPVLLIS
jgi:hypothetical protein